MAQSVKFADDMLVDDARAMAGLQSRSLAGQITHWARIGRAIERSGRFDHVRLSRVLAGEAETTALTPRGEGCLVGTVLGKDVGTRTRRRGLFRRTARQRQSGRS